MKKNTYILAAIIVVLIIAAGIFAGLYITTKASTDLMPTTTSLTLGSGSQGKVIQVVAAENFWGSLVSQLGGIHVNVLSIVSDPNTDPHEYESNSHHGDASRFGFRIFLH